MQFKSVIILAAVAFCASEASSLNSHERNKRQIDALVQNTINFVTSMYGKVEDAAESGLKNIYSTAENIEERFLEAATAFLKSVGINDVDLEIIAAYLKTNIQNCATSEDVKSKALDIKNNLYSCVKNDMDTVNNIITDVKSLINTAKTAHGLINTATESCYLDEGESFSFSHVTQCVSTLNGAVQEAKLGSIPALIVANVARAAKVAASVKLTVAPCVTAKLTTLGVSLGAVAAEVGVCVNEKLTNKEAQAVVVQAAPQLQALQTAAKFTSFLG